jgi:phospholipase/carboxylesterase
MSLETHIRPAAAEPEGALVLLHGRGADENDLARLLDFFDPAHRLVAVTPRGPLSLPPGGAHWYAVKEVGYPDPDTFGPTCERVGEWLDKWLADQGVSPERTILGGFSQGAVMAYSLGLGAGRPRPAGILAFSGFIPEVEGWELDDENARRLPVAIGHGIHDPVISVGFGRAAKERLEAVGADVVYRESPMAHSIDPGFIRSLLPWVEAVIPAR